MSHQIKPGAMGLPTDPEPPSAYANSMAAEIEAQLNALLIADGLPTLPMDNSPESRDRRRLFVAIARGVVKHFDDKRLAIDVVRSDGTVISPTFDIDGL